MTKAREYTVVVAENAADFIKKQTKRIQRQIMRKILSLAKKPRSKGIPIKGSDNVFRIRSGDYRIAYIIKDKRVFVLVVRIEHRKDFYNYFDK